MKNKIIKIKFVCIKCGKEEKLMGWAYEADMTPIKKPAVLYTCDECEENDEVSERSDKLIEKLKKLFSDELNELEEEDE